MYDEIQEEGKVWNVKWKKKINVMANNQNSENRKNIWWHVEDQIKYE